MATLFRSHRVGLLLAVAWAATVATPAWAANPCTGTPCVGHPCPQPRPMPLDPPFMNRVTRPDASTTLIVTPDNAIFPAVDPFGATMPGANFIEPTVFSNMCDGRGNEMPNTLPSTPDPLHPYNLHDPPVVTAIDALSPSQELRETLVKVRRRALFGFVDQDLIQRGLDILEGNPIADRVWSGIALLHYTGPEKFKVVQPICSTDGGATTVPCPPGAFDGTDCGTVVGGNVDVHQIWFDSHIESDTALLDPQGGGLASNPLGTPGCLANKTWTMTYTVDVLHRGSDDFSPFVMYFDDPTLSPPGMPPMPHVAMDQTFFPMEDGNRYVFEMKMSLAKYYNLTYTWGWRVHPPRVQVIENARKRVPPAPGVMPPWMNLLEYEQAVFGVAPRSSEAAKLAAIAQIGALAPEKQMWVKLRDAQSAGPLHVVLLMTQALRSFDEYMDRTKLPAAVRGLIDPNDDATLLYANNTLYGEMKGGGQAVWDKWHVRPVTYKATLLNGDHFPHGYMNVDFGGRRGWESQFQSAVPFDPDVPGSGGTGCRFSFGRVHWWVSAGGFDAFGVVVTPPADPAHPLIPGRHHVEITLGFEPSRRLRLYQFDPLHHDVQVWSFH